MSQHKLPLQSSELLQHLTVLDNPIAFFSDTNQSIITLCCMPEQSKTLRSNGGIHQFLDDLTSTAGALKASDQFRCGWLGYFGYPSSSSLSDKPIASFFYYPVSLKLCLETDEVWLNNPHQLPTQEIDNYLSSLLARIQQHPSPEHGKKRSWHPAWDEQQYQRAFDRVQTYLHEGDCYQINLTMPFYCADDLTQSSPVSLFEGFHPTFGVYMKTDTMTLFSVSPERFMKVDRQHMTAQPIKGTAPRGHSLAEDEYNKQCLLESGKNRAENLMIVDLLRNDLSQSAQPHSVKVTELLNLESHANVHHLVSTITADKKPEVSALGAVYRAFPGGSVTGVPKKRAMEIIEELEVEPRGPYCGSFGFIDDGGLVDFNILIRTITATRQGAVCWGGGGITVESTAKEEYQEIMDKVGEILNTPL